MKRVLIIIALISMFLFTSCDRYDQDYIIIIKAEDFISSFETTTQNALLTHDINSIMAFYSDDYLNDGVDKAQSRDFYDEQWSSIAIIEVSLIDANSLKYNIHVKDDSLSIDVQWEDYAKKIQNAYYWYGNQENPDVHPQPKQIALVEVLTGLWCPNCPNAEHALEDISENIPNQMITLNYHINDALALPNFNETPYYGNNPPVVLLQGSTKISGAGQTQFDQYQTIINNIITTDADISFDDISFVKTEDEISGSVKINTYSNIDFADTYLRVVVYEKETDKAHFVTHELAKNVVRARTMVDLSDKHISQKIDFNINLTSVLDDDTYLVIWVQKNLSFDEINPETDKVYNAIEIPLNN
ncbi:MAG: hypothetical protein PHF36_05690 [Candidatus Cloacimonetes bacterium]|nr:hypothetical protein [Candidatus Cloacimonadota bacterium]